MDAGVIAAEEAEHHPESNVITRAVGFRDEPLPDFWLVPARAGMRLLICSDGLTKELGDERIRLHLAAGHARGRDRERPRRRGPRGGRSRQRDGHRRRRARGAADRATEERHAADPEHRRRPPIWEARRAAPLRGATPGQLGALCLEWRVLPS